MFFKLLMTVHLCAAFPLKCPAPAQWALRANGHCADPSKYFCLQNDLIKGYSENCTRSDFQQPGRKAVLRGGIDADICSLERYQPFPIRFYTNGSTYCIFLKSFCNEEGQVLYDHGDRNTDATCRCDYRQGYDFQVKPNNPCFCKPSQEDCSCYFKTCSNTSHVLSLDYQCVSKTDRNLVTHCHPITDETDISRRKTEMLETIPIKQNISFLVKWNNLAAAVVLILVFLCVAVMVSLLFLKTVVARLLWRICCRVYFIDESHGKITLYEGESFELKYQTSRRTLPVEIYKSGILERTKNTLRIQHVDITDEGHYYAECYGLTSKHTKLTVLPISSLAIESPEPELHVIEGKSLRFIYKLSIERKLCFFKNNKYIAETKNIGKESRGGFNFLTIKSVTPEDAGLYHAAFYKLTSKVTKLAVQAMFTSDFDPIYCIEGDELLLQCSVYADNIRVTWQKDETKIKENENITIDWDGCNHLMTFKSAHLNDSGLYSIIAGSVKKHITVTIQALFKHELKSKTIMEGLGVIFECEVEKRYPVEWFKDAGKVHNSSNITIDEPQERVYRLTILKTTLENKGKYEIKINNKISGADLDVKEIPDAIKEMSEKDRSMFLKAAKHGTAVRYNIRILLVGKEGVGKTSLLRRLMREEMNDIESTNGINIEVKNCKIDLHTKEWIFSKGNESSLREYPNEQYADCGFWDFAGQKEFYATHQTFLSRNAIYLLVVDVSEDFKMNTFEKMIQNQYDKNGEYIDFWLDNIHCYTVNNTDGSLTLENDLLNPPVIIVGTGMDKVEDIEKTKNSFEIYINKLLRDHQKRKHLRKLCFLSNTRPSEYKTEFQTLRNEIFETAKELPKWGDNLPTRWICLEKEIDRLINNEEFVISYDTAKDLASRCSFSIEEVTLELDSFLKYEHEIGNLIFFEDIKSHIILESKWLVDVFKCFIAPFQFQSQFLSMHEWSLLQSTGHLSKHLIEKLFSKVQVLNQTKNKDSDLEERNEQKKLALQILKEKKAYALEIMEKFDIIVKPITTTKNEEYYMPCMMDATHFNQILKIFKVRNNKCLRTSWFGLQFSFLPPAFFNHILVTFLKKYSLCTVREGTLAIYRGTGVFNLEASKCLKLVLCLSENSVAMQVWQFKKENRMCFQENRKYLTQIVGFLRQKYRINISYRCFLKCSEGTHHEIADRIYLNDIPKTAQSYCPEHTNHTLDELRRFWFQDEGNVVVHQKDHNAVKCHYCENVFVYRCYECRHVLCGECFLKHDELSNTKHHTFQSTKNEMLKSNTFEIPDLIVDMKALPGGLFVFVLRNSEWLLTYSVSDKQQYEISVSRLPCSIEIVDKNTVVVLLANPYEKVYSIKIIDIRQNQVIEHVDMTLDLPFYLFCPMFFTDDQLYIRSQLGITVTDMAGKLDRKIDLGFEPSDMCYDEKAASIFCINPLEKKLICIDRDGNIIFTFLDPSLKDAKRLTIDSYGYVLILCHEHSNVKYFKVHRISNDGKSSEVIVTGKQNETQGTNFTSICFQEESDEMAIGVNKIVYTYRKSSLK